MAKTARRKSGVRVEMDCFFCGSPVAADSDTRAILCSACVARLAGTPEQINKFPKREVSMTDIVTKQSKTATPKVVKPNAGFGRGWHLKKEFTAPNGKVYSFGKLISEAPVAG